MNELEHTIVFLPKLISNCGITSEENDAFKKSISLSNGNPVAWHLYTESKKILAARAFAKTVIFEFLTDILKSNINGGYRYSKILFDVMIPENNFIDAKLLDNYKIRAIDMSEAALALNPTGCLINKKNFMHPEYLNFMNKKYMLDEFVVQIDEILCAKHLTNGKRLEWPVEFR